MTGGTAVWYVNNDDFTQARIWTGWATNTTSSATTGTLSFGNYGYGFAATSATSTTSGWYTLSRVTAEAQRVWMSDAWQKTKHSAVPFAKRSAEQIAKDAAAEKLQQEAYAKERAERAKIAAEAALFRQAAQARAGSLLDAFLTAEQKQMLKSHNYFELTVHSMDGADRRYRIERGSHGNIKRLDARGEVLERLCVPLAEHGLPDADHMLAQKMLLETNEELLRRTANITNPRGELIHRSVAMA